MLVWNCYWWPRCVMLVWNMKVIRRRWALCSMHIQSQNLDPCDLWYIRQANTTINHPTTFDETEYNCPKTFDGRQAALIILDLFSTLSKWELELQWLGRDAGWSCTKLRLHAKRFPVTPRNVVGYALIKLCFGLKATYWNDTFDCGS